MKLGTDFSDILVKTQFYLTLELPSCTRSTFGSVSIPRLEVGGVVVEYHIQQGHWGLTRRIEMRAIGKWGLISHEEIGRIIEWNDYMKSELEEKKET